MDQLQSQAMLSLAQKLQEQRDKISLASKSEKLLQGPFGDEEDIQDALTDCQRSDNEKRGDDNKSAHPITNIHLFESNHQNILSVLTQPKNMKEWNSLMEHLVDQKASSREEELKLSGAIKIEDEEGEVNLDEESPYDQITRLRMIRNRRQDKNRPINGPAEWYLKVANNKGAAKLKTQIVTVLTQIESLEQELITVERNEQSDSSHFLLHDLRNKRFIQNQYKLKRNRLIEEYERLTKQWKIINNNLY